MTYILADFYSPMAFIQIALVLFFSVFVSVVVREAMRTRQEVTHLSNMPLENADATEPTQPGVNP